MEGVTYFYCVVKNTGWLPAFCAASFLPAGSKCDSLIPWLDWFVAFCVRVCRREPVVSWFASVRFPSLLPLQPEISHLLGAEFGGHDVGDDESDLLDRHEGGDGGSQDGELIQGFLEIDLGHRQRRRGDLELGDPLGWLLLLLLFAKGGGIEVGVVLREPGRRVHAQDDRGGGGDRRPHREGVVVVVVVPLECRSRRSEPTNDGEDECLRVVA